MDAARCWTAVAYQGNSSRGKGKSYQDIADINGEIRAVRKEISLCQAIRERTPRMEKDIASSIPKEREVTKEHGKRR